MRIAVVFDSAGTLLNVYRVAKDVRRGRILENVASTNMVVKDRGCALVALRADSSGFLEGLGPEMLLSACIAASCVGLDIICRGSECPAESITEAALADMAATIGDMQDAVAAVKLKCKDTYYVNMGFVVDVPHGSIPYVLATGGRIFGGVAPMIGRLQSSGIDVYIASGDNRKSLSSLARELGVPEAQVFDALSPSGKYGVVRTLQERYDRVVMVGDGINDQKALEAADIGVLTVQQEIQRPQELLDAADVVVTDILDVERVIEESLHNRDNTGK
jgi:Cu+-exporting ATPase